MGRSFPRTLCAASVVLFLVSHFGATVALAEPQEPPEQVCYQGKLGAGSTHSKRLAKCYFKLAKRPTSDFAKCETKALAKSSRYMVEAEHTTLKQAFLCPASAEELAIAPESAWIEQLMTSSVFQANALPNKCVALRASETGRYADAYADCWIENQGGTAIDVATCAAAAAARFAAKWASAALTAACTGDSAAIVRSTIEDAIDAQVTFLTIACQDGLLAGLEACDDGNDTAGDGCEPDCTRTMECGNGRIDFGEACDDENVTSGDGCTDTCLEEECGLVGMTVACLYCPDGASPDATFTTCICDLGYTDLGGSCEDIDECDLGIDACAPGEPCVNVPGSYSCPIECTQAAFEAALAACGPPTGVITFDCTDTVIPIDAESDDNLRKPTCDGLVIDGLDRDITFEMQPMCFEVPVLDSQCNKPLGPGDTCQCPNIDEGTVLMSFDGDNGVIRNLTVRGFFDGVRTKGANNTVEKMVFEKQCDDSVSNHAEGVGNLFQNLTVREGCDKCAQANGNVALNSSEPLLREHYSAIFRRVDFLGCAQPLRTIAGGRILVDQCFFEPLEAPSYPCDGPRFTSGPADTQIVHFRNSEIAGCQRGLRFGGGVEALVSDNRIVAGRFRGIALREESRAVIWDNTILGNGGVYANEAGFGGVATVEAALADLGGGSLMIDGEPVSSPGRNMLCGNVTPGGHVLQDVHNLTETTVTAENNWWCGDPATRVTGDVDTDPSLPEPP